MNVYKVTTYGMHRKPIAAVTVKAESKPEAMEKAKAEGAFTNGVRGCMVTKMKEENDNELTLEFCAKEIVKNGGIRIGKSILTHCYDGTVSVTDWNGDTRWFPWLDIIAVQYFIDIQPK